MVSTGKIGVCKSICSNHILYTVSGVQQADIKHKDAHLMSWNYEVPREKEVFHIKSK